MAFCSGCGAEYVANAKFCHNCGDEVSQQHRATVNTETTPTTSGARINSLNTNKGRISTPGTASTSGYNSNPLSFGAYRMRKEEDRSSNFKSKGPKPKKVKTQDTIKATVDVKVNVGIMVFRDGKLIPKRNTSLPLIVNDLIGQEELLNKAVDKQSRFNSVLISNEPRLYKLLFGNHARVQEVRTIPGSDEPFTLRRYKEEIGKPYSKISFFLCSLADYLEHTINSSSSDEDERHKLPIKQPMSPINRNEASFMEPELPSESFQDEVTVISPMSTAQTIQCPICLENYPLEDIQGHADACSMWLLNEDDKEVSGDNNVDSEKEESNTIKITDMSKDEVKQNLIDEISQLAKAHLVNETPKRITVRRKAIWEDFKHELHSKITPTTRLKVVFAGEPAVDDGGPRRELFSGKRFIYCLPYFSL